MKNGDQFSCTRESARLISEGYCPLCKTGELIRVSEDFFECVNCTKQMGAAMAGFTVPLVVRMELGRLVALKEAHKMAVRDVEKIGVLLGLNHEQKVKLFQYFIDQARSLEESFIPE